MFVASSTLAAGRPNDFEPLDERQLRRLLRMANIHMTGRETRPELLHSLRFLVECDDMFFDNSLMPNRLQRYQILQACMLLLVYYFAPCTRALEIYWLCRSVGGSGTQEPASEPDEYQHT